MNAKFPFLLLTASMLFISCKEELQPQDSSSVADTTAVAQTPNTVQPAMQPMPVQPAQNATVTQTPGSTITPAPVGKGMNPAHGQPGHRCDIPVGAPLNSKAPAANQVASANTTITPVPATTPTNATPAILDPNKAPATATKTPEGMNPPHGENGHRCDIAVGAPLK